MGVGRSTMAVRSRPATALELGAALTELHNHIYANDGLSAGEAFAEVTKLLFMKVLDDRKGAAGKARGFSISPAELAATTRGDAAGAAPFVARLEELFDAATRDHAEVFRRDERLHLKAATLAHCVSRLAPFDLLDASFDAKGVAFQRMVSSAWRGERGQFFTPEPVVRLMVEMLEPRSGELVLDPA